MNIQIFYLLVYIFEAVIAFMYFSDNYNLRVRTPFAVLSVLVIYTTGFAINIVGGNNLAINLIGFFAMNLLFCKIAFNISWISGVFHSSILLAIMFISEMIVEFIITTLMRLPVDAYKDNVYTLIIVGIICKVLYLVICKLISYSFSYKKNNAITDMKKTFLLFLFPIIITAMITLLFYISAIYDLSKTINTICAFISIVSLALCCFIFIYNQILQAQQNELISLKAQQEINENNATFYRLLERKNEEQRVIMHDMKHHFSALTAIESIEEVKTYIDEIEPQLAKYQYIGKTNNKMFDLILSKYSLLCKQEGINFSADTRSSNLSFMEDSDLSSLLGNLFDNAFEAAKGCDNPHIRLVTKNEKNFIVLSVINSSNHAPDINSKGKLLTTKINKELHGYGTKSIEKTTEKYNGICEWDYDDEKQEFRCRIMFNTSHP